MAITILIFNISLKLRFSLSLTFQMKMIKSFIYNIILEKTKTSLALKCATAATYTVVSCSFRHVTMTWSNSHFQGLLHKNAMSLSK